MKRLFITLMLVTALAGCATPDIKSPSDALAAGYSGVIVANQTIAQLVTANHITAAQAQTFLDHSKLARTALDFSHAQLSLFNACKADCGVYESAALQQLTIANQILANLQTALSEAK